MKRLLFALFLIICCPVNAQEVCINGIDDDADGLVDLNDPDCDCSTGTGGPPPSIIPNASFEDTLCCPQNYSELNCADVWIQASDATSDYFNTCSNPPVFSAITDYNLIPFPDGEGMAGFGFYEQYKEYLGSCLITPMLAGTPYTLKLTTYFAIVDPFGEQCTGDENLQPIDLTIFGAPSCGNIPWFGFECPTAPFVPLKSVSCALNAGWQVATFNFTPTTDIAEIVIGPSCTLPPGYSYDSLFCFPYIFVDNLVLNDSDAFGELTVTSTGTMCLNNIELNAGLATGETGTWQWYFNGVAIAGQTNPVLDLTANGDAAGVYTISFTNDTSCYRGIYTVTPPQPPTVSVNSAAICTGGSTILIASGAATYSWSPATGLSATTGNFVIASPATTTTYTVTGTGPTGCVATANAVVTVVESAPLLQNDTIICDEQFQFTHNQGSIGGTWTVSSGVDLLYQPTTLNPHATFAENGTYDLTYTDACGNADHISIQVANCVVIIPNIFTPNNDASNDVWELTVPDNYFKEFSCVILNRWGNVLFESTDPYAAWNGTDKNSNKVSEGVYFYRIEGTLFSDEVYDAQGFIHLSK